MSILYSYSPLCPINSATSPPSRIALPKSRPIHLKAVGNSSSAIACFESDAAKYPIKDKETPIELRYEAFPTVMDINEIRKLLPHRPPCLLVDRLVEVTSGGDSAVGIKHFTINEKFFLGHFPGKPIVPGVLLIEAMTQVGGLLVVLGLERYKSGYLVGIDKMRFKNQVVVGDTLVMRMTTIKVWKHMGIVKLVGKAYVGGELVCEGEFLLYASKDEF